MSRGFAEEHVHNVCKVCDYAIRNEKCPGCGFSFESFSIKEHDAAIRRQTIDGLIEELLKHKSKDEYPVICMDEWTLRRLAEKVKVEAHGN